MIFADRIKREERAHPLWLKRGRIEATELFVEAFSELPSKAPNCVGAQLKYIEKKASTLASMFQPWGVTIMPCSEAIKIYEHYFFERQRLLFSALVKEKPSDQIAKQILMNIIEATDGFFFLIPKNMDVPVYLSLDSFRDFSDIWNLIVLEDYASIKVIEGCLNPSNEKARRSNSSSVFIASKKSRLDLYYFNPNRETRVEAETQFLFTKEQSSLKVGALLDTTVTNLSLIVSKCDTSQYEKMVLDLSKIYSQEKLTEFLNFLPNEYAAEVKCLLS